ncbi:cache domain-containing sensor histidine kinase [Fundicoccus sp. Sow4_H7]|uniref:cache domain-containing sensor histidine kinase n=1 Tax=Fundicoccus sp. Sow4_H7 TaxID=3438784 RepID=UPI003F9360FF
MRQTQPLQRLIFAVLMILAAVVLIIGLSVSYNFQRNLLIDQTAETTQINAMQTSESLQNMFLSMDNILRAVSIELQLHDHDRDALQELIDSSVSLNHDLDSITIVAPEGDIYAFAPSYRRLLDANGEEDGTANVSNSVRPLEADWYDPDKQFDQSLYSIPHQQKIYRQNDVQVISVTVPFVHNNQDYIMIADFRHNLLERYYKADFNTTYGDSYIINDQGDIIYTPDNLNERTLHIHEEIQGQRLDNQLIIETGNDFVAATSRLGITPWTVVHVTYINDLIGSSLNNILQSSAVIFIVILIVIGYFSFIASNYISRPLENIVVKMQSFKLNRIDETKLTASNAYKEANFLTQSYNQLVDTIDYLMERIQAEEKALRKSERNTLEAQIQPHFLYNTLESILWMIERGNNQDASEMVQALGKMLRISLSKGQEIISLERELEHVEHYFVIQSLRYKSQFSYQINIPADLKEAKVIKLVVQPLVENAIYHGVSRTVDHGEINVTVVRDGGQILVTVADNGLGIDEEKLASIRQHLNSPNAKMGVGLINVHQRLQIYYGKEYGVKIESELDYGTEVTINFPLEGNEVIK